MAFNGDRAGISRERVRQLLARDTARQGKQK
jgi:hypothetical protein